MALKQYLMLPISGITDIPLLMTFLHLYTVNMIATLIHLFTGLDAGFVVRQCTVIPCFLLQNICIETKECLCQ